MKKAYSIKAILVNIFFALCIVQVSILLLDGGGDRVVSVFMSNHKDMSIHSVETKEKKIAISFDAAYGNQFTDEILNILDKNKIKATFFLVGNWVDKYPDKVKIIYDKGHEIGNHSTSHPYFTQLDEIKIKEEIFTTSDKIKAITGEGTALFRPPFGDYDSHVVKVVKDTGHYCILWDVDSLDWKDPGEDVMFKRVTNTATNGSVILYHLNAEQTPKVLDKTIKELKNKGYTFVKISELIYKENYYIDHTGRQKPIK
jgi:peptidoglycan-N-acetylglucosamine deacetylase